MRILITLCARGGSKGIPGKNIKPLAGRPLIDYTIDVAKSFALDCNAKIALSTDDEVIKIAARIRGIETNYIRPDILASDTAGKVETIKDLLIYEEAVIGDSYDYILDLDLTSPLRTKQDLKESFKQIQDDKEALSLFSVSEASRNPYFNMVEKNEHGYYDLVKKSDDGSVMSRQKAPPVYDLNASFYWYSRAFFNMGLVSPITSRSLVFVMDHICFDLDHQVDFDFLEYLVLNKKVEIL